MAAREAAQRYTPREKFTSSNGFLVLLSHSAGHSDGVLHLSLYHGLFVSCFHRAMNKRRPFGYHDAAHDRQ